MSDHVTPQSVELRLKAMELEQHKGHMPDTRQIQLDLARWQGSVDGALKSMENNIQTMKERDLVQETTINRIGLDVSKHEAACEQRWKSQDKANEELKTKLGRVSKTITNHEKKILKLLVYAAIAQLILTLIVFPVIAGIILTKITETTATKGKEQK